MKLSQFLLAVKVRLIKPTLYVFRVKVKRVKQYSKVTYLGFILDQTLSRESIATRVVSKLDTRLRFFYQQSNFLDIPLRRLLRNAMIQPSFYYACNAWYIHPNKNLKMRL